MLFDSLHLRIKLLFHVHCFLNEVNWSLYPGQVLELQNKGYLTDSSFSNAASLEAEPYQDKRQSSWKRESSVAVIPGDITFEQVEPKEKMLT